MPADARSGMIPNRFSLAPLLSGLFAFVPFAGLALFTRGHGMGWGDVKLAALGRTAGRARQPIAFGPYLAASIGAALAVGSTS
jgi:hypothetical protein